MKKIEENKKSYDITVIENFSRTGKFITRVLYVKLYCPKIFDICSCSLTKSQKGTSELGLGYIEDSGK